MRILIPTNCFIQQHFNERVVEFNTNYLLKYF
jgi:hypothetical protein